MHTLIFDINETDKKFIATWTLEDVQGRKPQARTSHSAVAFKNQYVIICAGEGYDESNINNILLIFFFRWYR